jgi:hypothetical protein
MTSEWVINRKTANSESVLLRMRYVTANINRCWRDAVASRYASWGRPGARSAMT